MSAASTPLIPRVGLLRIDVTQFSGTDPTSSVNKANPRASVLALRSKASSLCPLDYGLPNVGADSVLLGVRLQFRLHVWSR